MEPEDCINRVQDLLRSCGVPGQWNVVVVPNMGSRLGTCDWTHKRIRISGVLLSRGTHEQIEDTLRHEVAHALARHLYGPQIAPHGPQWKHCARQLGATPRASVRDVENLELKSTRARRSTRKPTMAVRASSGRSIFYVPALGRELVPGDVFVYRNRHFTVLEPKRTRFTATLKDGAVYSVPGSLIPHGRVEAATTSTRP